LDRVQKHPDHRSNATSRANDLLSSATLTRTDTRRSADSAVAFATPSPDASLGHLEDQFGQLAVNNAYGQAQSAAVAAQGAASGSSWQGNDAVTVRGNRE
jgi:hypothetical protein